MFGFHVSEDDPEHFFVHVYIMLQQQTDRQVHDRTQNDFCVFHRYKVHKTKNLYHQIVLIVIIKEFHCQNNY
jgi:hypothetical protein